MFVVVVVVRFLFLFFPFAVSIFVRVHALFDLFLCSVLFFSPSSQKRTTDSRLESVVSLLSAEAKKKKPHRRDRNLSLRSVLFFQ